MLHWYGKHLALNGICKHTQGFPVWITNDVLTTYVFVQHHYFSEWIINSLRPNDAYICVSELTIIGSDNGLLPARHQAITWTNASLLSIGLVRTICSEIIFIQEMHLKMWSAGMAAIFSRGDVLTVHVFGQHHFFQCMPNVYIFTSHYRINPWCSTYRT